MSTSNELPLDVHFEMKIRIGVQGLSEPSYFLGGPSPSGPPDSNFEPVQIVEQTSPPGQQSWKLSLVGPPLQPGQPPPPLRAVLSYDNPHAEGGPSVLQINPNAAPGEQAGVLGNDVLLGAGWNLTATAIASDLKDLPVKLSQDLGGLTCYLKISGTPGQSPTLAITTNPNEATVWDIRRGLQNQIPPGYLDTCPDGQVSGGPDVTIGTMLMDFWDAILPTAWTTSAVPQILYWLYQFPHEAPSDPANWRGGTKDLYCHQYLPHFIHIPPLGGWGTGDPPLLPPRDAPVPK